MERKEIKYDELKDLYIKTCTYNDQKDKIKDINTKQGYLMYICKDAEGLVKLRMAYQMLYPEDESEIEFLDKELEKALRFSPEMVAVYIKNIVIDISMLYAKAFKIFIENLAGNKKEEQKESQKQTEVYYPNIRDIVGSESEKEENNEKVYTYMQPIDLPQLKTEKDKNTKKSGLFAKFFKKKKIEFVSLEEIGKIKEKTERRNQSDAEMQARLDRYNAMVKARAESNRYLQGEIVNDKAEYYMQRGA